MPATPADAPDWTALRALFPALARGVYLDTASSGPVSTPAMLAGQRFYTLSNARGNRAAPDWQAELASCRRRIAALIGAREDEIGFVPNTSMAMNAAALMFEGAGSVLTGADEHPTVVTPWLARGYAVHRAPRDRDGRIPLSAYAGAMTRDTRIIAVSHVRFNDGQVNDLAGLAVLARAHGAHLVVDAIQSAGILPIDVGLGIDVLGFAGFKWLNAGYGGGGLYVRDGLLARYGLPIAGNRSRASESLDEVVALDPLLKARAFELGAMAAPNLMALNASLGLIAGVGREAILVRVAALTARLRAGLARLGLRAASEDVSPIVSVAVAAPEAAAAAFEAADVRVALRAGRIRVAVSWYNDEADIDRCLEVFATLAGAPG